VYAQPINRRPNRAVRPSPVFLAFVALALLGAVLSWSDSNSNRIARFGVFCLVVGGWVISLCLHEFAHAYAAYRAGDHSVEAAGYLTLNPVKYAHPVLSIVLPIIFIAAGGIGLPGGAVYLHQHAFHSRASRSLAAAAGPAVNVVCAVTLLIFVSHHGVSGPHIRFWAGLAFLAFLQVSAAVLNLLPVPGLDGYAILEPYLDPSVTRPLEQVKPFGMLVLFLLLWEVPSINAAFFNVVQKIYGAAGASAELRAGGYFLFRFWSKTGV
jgi:Zn-dependent protease